MSCLPAQNIHNVYVKPWGFSAKDTKGVPLKHTKSSYSYMHIFYNSQKDVLIPLPIRSVYSINYYNCLQRNRRLNWKQQTIFSLCP